MKIPSFNFSSARRSRAGVTLLEILVSVSLLMVIILGLYSMFARTQSVLRGTVTAVDILEGSRATFDVVRRDFEQITPVGTPLASMPFATNFWVEDDNIFSIGVNAKGLVIPLSAGLTVTNSFHEVFFTVFNPNKEFTPNNWLGVAYRVASRTNPLVPADEGVGTLYRFVTNANRYNNSFQSDFLNITAPVNTNPMTNYWQRMADNVVHFKAEPVVNGVVTTLLPNTPVYFTDTNVPAYVSLELGFVEAPAIEQARARTSTLLQWTFMTNQADRMHYYRAMIPITTSGQ